jgi:thymidylate synthase
MRLLIIYNSDYGERFLHHVSAHAPREWAVAGYKMTVSLPAVIDDPEAYLPPDLPRADLMIYVGQDRKLAELISDLAEASGAAEVLVPVDNRSHLPAGLARQVKRRMDRSGVASAFPAPFCSLKPEDGQGIFIREFAGKFGSPRLRVTTAEGCLQSVEVLRGAPCGNTHYVARHIPGTQLADSVEETARQFHAHPCLGSMDMDRELGDTILHLAGHLIMNAVREASKNAEGTT